MGSKRAQKAKKRAQRESRRQVRRARHATGTAKKETPGQGQPTRLASLVGSQQADSPVAPIGYVGFDGVDLLRYGGDCIVASSPIEMQRTAEILRPGTKVTIRPATFEQLYEAMDELGEVFCYDDEAYARFRQEAARRGKPVTRPRPEELDVFFPPPDVTR